MSLLGPISTTAVLYTALLRTLPTALLIWVAPPFFVAMADVIYENVDAHHAMCVDGATHDEYNILDKSFDALFILIVSTFSMYKYFSTKNTKLAYYWTWVPVNLILAGYRLIGIVLILATGNKIFTIFFPNLWLPYFWFFTFMQYTRTFRWFRSREGLYYTILVLLALWKIGEEIFRGLYESPDANVTCEMYAHPSTHSSVNKVFLWTYGFVAPTFVALIVRHWVDGGDI